MELTDHLLRRALTDGDTGLPSRAALRLELEQAIARAERYGFPVGLVRVTVDPGSRVSISQLARRIRDSLRRSDLLARTGERELTLLVTHHDSIEAEHIAERIRVLCADPACSDDPAAENDSADAAPPRVEALNAGPDPARLLETL